MPDTDGAAHVWDLMEKIGFCMLASLDGGEIRSRPMAAHVRREEDCVYFLTDADGAKDDEIAARPQVNLAFADPSGQNYVSVTGRATVSNDRAKIEELFGAPARAWWDGPDDPSIRVLKVKPVDAQYWDGPGIVAAYVRMAAAAVAETRPALGRNEKVEMAGS